MRSLNSCEGSSSSKREKELAPLRSGKMQLQNFSKNDFGRARNPAGELAMPRHNRNQSLSDVPSSGRAGAESEKVSLKSSELTADTLSTEHKKRLARLVGVSRKTV